MRILFFYIFLITAPYKIFAQTSSICAPSSLFTKAYDNDIKDLALERIYSLHSPDTSKIEIPDIYSDTIRNSMSAIFNLDTLLQADSVFKRYCIHPFPNFGFINWYLEVGIDTSYAWTHQWTSGHLATGNASVDNFMNRYNYTLLYPFHGQSFVFVPTRAINDRVFADSLALFPGITYVRYPDYPRNPEMEINYSTDSVSNYSFSIGWGDCLAGCLNNKTWNYKVDSLCTVTLLSVKLWMTAPVPFPAPANCFYDKTYTANINNSFVVNVYPNPANEILHISTPGNERYTYILTDLPGQTISKGIAGNNTVVNISAMPPGIYILRVANTAGEISYQRIVKE
jgi:hypothetical protein